jgi:protein transport protein HofC
VKIHRLYLWQAVTIQGKIQTGELIAEAKADVYQHIILQGLQPVIIKAGKYIPSHYWQGNARIIFARQLATLLNAGLPLLEILQLLAKENPSPA